MSIRIRWEDTSGMKRLDNAMGLLTGHHKHLFLQRAVNHTGDKAKTQVIRTLAKQTGLKRGTIVKAIRVGRAWGASGNASQFSEGRGSLEYVLSAKGGDISLKYFAPRETRKGVTAAPFGKRKLIAKSFIKGGQFPARVEAKGLNGHVFTRTGVKAVRIRGKSKDKKRETLKFEDSGVVIPAEMIKGATAAVFMKTVEAELAKRAMHELNRLVGGIFD